MNVNVVPSAAKDLRDSVSRREFLAALAATAAACARPSRASVAAPAASQIRLGYSAAAWGSADLLAVADIATLGFTGIEVGGRTLQHFRRQPSVLRDLLAENKLTLVALAGGAVGTDPQMEVRMVADLVARAQFVHEVGGLFLQVAADLPPNAPEPEFERLGRALTAIGRRSADVGVTLAYQPRMGTLGENPESADRILAAAEPRFVKLLLDVAHYQLGGGDSAAALRRHRDRLAYVHLSDAQTTPAPDGTTPIRFVELGQGRVNLPAVLDTLREIGYDGWAVVELEAAEPGRKPGDSAAISRRYLDAKLPPR